MQDRAITDIGAIEFEKRRDADAFELFVQNPFPGRAFKMLLVQFISEDASVLTFKGIDIRNVNEKNYGSYAYRKGSSRGGDVTFTTKANKDFDKKLKTLLEIQFPKLIHQAEELGSEHIELFKIWNNCVKDNFNVITDELEKAFSSLEKKEQMACMFSLSIQINGEEKLMGDFSAVRRLVENDGLEGSYKKYGVVSKGVHTQCSICNQTKENVFGFGSPFKYSTVDKTGTVSGFFSQENNWINYPICEDCALKMELGKSYINNNLTKYFFGKSYYLIPKTVFAEDTTALKTALQLFTDLDYKIKNAEIISSTEDYLMEQIGMIEQNIFTLNLLFFEENPTTKAIKIKLMLEEIPPSRFRKLFIEVPEIINGNPLFKDIDYHFKKRQKQNLRFSFRLVKQFFADNFYEVIYKVFMGKQVSQKELYKRFMDVIRENYLKKMNGDSYERGDLLVAKTHMIQLYFEELNLIHNP